MNKILHFLIVFTISLAMSSTVLQAKKKRSYKKSKTRKSKKKKTTKKVSKIKEAKKEEKKEEAVVKVKEKKLEIIHKRPEAAVVKQPISIDIEILKNEKVSFVVLSYSSYVLEEWKKKEMKQSSTKYFANIPADFVLKGGVSYYIEAFNALGETVAYYGTKELPMLIQTHVIKRAGGEIVLIAGKKVKKEEKVLSLKDELATFDLDSDIETVSSKVQKTKLAPAIVSVVTRNTILKTGSKTLIEVLRYLPGIDVKILPSGRYSVSIRGVAKDGNILVLLNGNRINNPYNSEAIYDMSTSFIEKVEVIRGPGSSLFGTDAVAGVINIFTTKKDKSVKASAGLYHNYNVAGNYSINRRGIQVDLSGGVVLDNGANENIAIDDSHEKEWSLTHGDNNKFQTDRWSKNGYLSARFSTEKFELFIFAMENKRGTWVGPNFTATKGSTYKTDTIVYDLKYSFIKNNKIDFKAKVYGNFLFSDNYMVTAPQNYVSDISKDDFVRGKITKENYNVLTLTAELSLAWELMKNLNILTGLSYQHLNILSYDLTRNYHLITEEYHGGNFDIYNEDSSLEQDGKIRSSIAYYLQSTYDYNDFGATLGLRFDYYDDFGLTINPRAGLVYNVLDMVVLKALYGQAFRAPTIKELYDQTDNSSNGILGNKNLDPENVKTAEVGMELGLWKLNIGTNFFYNMNENIIAPFDKDGGGSVGRYENIGSTDDLGVEAEVKVLLNKYFNAFINVSWFQRKFEWNNEIWRNDKGENITPELNDRKSLLTDIPMRAINIGVNLNYKNLGIFLGVRNRSRALNNNRMVLEGINTVDMSEYWKFDFNVSYNVTDNFLLYFAGTDLGTTHYASPSNLGNSVSVFGVDGLVQPGYTLRLGLIYRFNFERE